MTDRRIVFGENGRNSCRGLHQESEAYFVAHQRDDEVLTYVWDFANWLQTGETISSVTREASGTGVTGTSADTTTMTQKLSGRGYVDFKAVTSTGQTKEFRVVIRARTEDDSAWCRDYD